MDMPQQPTARNRSWLHAVVVIALGAVALGNLQAEKPAALQQQAAPTAKPGSLVAIADLHGDVEKARQALRLVSVVDSQGRWAAEGITVVQLGDLVDRGTSSLEVLRYMHSLQDQALRHNSRLVLLLGNHELLNLHGDYRYVAPEELTQLGQQLQQDKAATTEQDAASAQDISTAAAAAAAGPAVASQHDAATAAYLAGLEVWSALWRKPAGSQTRVTSAAATSAVTVSATAARTAENTTNSSSSSTSGPAATADGAAAAAGGAGWVRASVIQRHQLLAVHGRGGPCATAFVHAGLIGQALNQLLLVGNGSSSSTRQGNAPPASVSQATAAEPTDAGHAGTISPHKVLHHRHSTTAPGDSSSSSSDMQAATGATSPAAAAVPVGVVSDEELRAINSVVREALQNCNDRSCAGGSLPLQRAMAVLGAGQGPVWTRQQAQGRESSVCRHLEQVLARLGVRRLVVGHTPQASGRAAARCGARLLLLDTGMSSGMLGSPAAAWVCHPGVILNLQPLDNDDDDGDGALTATAENVGTSSRGASSGMAGSQVGDGASSLTGARSSGGGSRTGGEARGSEGYSVVAYADGTVATV